MEATLREFEGTPIRSDGVEAALRDRKLAERLESAYREHFDWEPDPAQIFRWVVHAVARGTDAAVQLAREEGRSEWAEIDSFYRREVRAELPGTCQELVDEIANPAKDDDITDDIVRWARAFDALSDCGICGEEIVRADALAEALVEHYGLEGDEADEAREALEQAIFHSGVEVGSWDSSSLCNYHGHVMSRDD